MKCLVSISVSNYARFARTKKSRPAKIQNQEQNPDLSNVNSKGKKNMVGTVKRTKEQKGKANKRRLRLKRNSKLKELQRRMLRT